MAGTLTSMKPITSLSLSVVIFMSMLGSQSRSTMVYLPAMARFQNCRDPMSSSYIRPPKMQPHTARVNGATGSGVERQSLRSTGSEPLLANLPSSPRTKPPQELAQPFVGSELVEMQLLQPDGSAK
ncbi:hypothetical protein [Bosea sp. AS-1]|uniref:hypothetical protein n=1 Tax=Bosea sp. AS-1 TaxID=2015316 RepID=UPI000B77D9DC|nr:hypothetical protein [Bosea sp. AS-1]